MAISKEVAEAVDGKSTPLNRSTHEILAATEKLLGPDHCSVAISLDWLGNTDFRQGPYMLAETHLRRGRAIAEKATGIRLQAGCEHSEPH